MSPVTPNIAHTLSLHARQRPRHPAVIHGSQQLDHRAFDEGVSRRAAALQAMGVGPGTLVGLALSDTIEHLLLLFAVARAGAAILPLDCRWTPAEAQRVVQHFQPGLVVVDAGSALEAGRRLTIDEDWAMRVAGALSDGPFPSFPDGERGLVMSLSSGTTGRPKGPLLSHAQLMSRFHVQWADLGFGSQARFLNATPLYFGGGRSFCMSTLYAGGTVVLCPPPWTPEQLASELQRTQATVLFLVPTMIRRLLASPPPVRAALGSLKLLVSSGSALTADERRAIRGELCPNFVEYYSSTEGGGVTVLTPRDQEHRGDSVGRAVLGVEVSIVDDEDRPLAAGEIGRIRYRGPGVATGFHADPVASQEAFRHGWFYPGDLGVMDDEGYLFLKGRAKDMIIRGGVNIHPQEIEAVLASHPGVLEPAVVGWPSREYNEEVAAFVVLRATADASASAEALRAWCARHLAPYKVPRQVFVVDDLPRTPVGKVLKSALVDRLPPL